MCRNNEEFVELNFLGRVAESQSGHRNHVGVVVVIVVVAQDHPSLHCPRQEMITLNKCTYRYLPSLSDLLCPTLADSVFGPVNIMEGEDTELVRGELTFTPRYPYYQDTPTDSE